MQISVRAPRGADHRVEELALDEHRRALDLETQPDEERRHLFEIGNGDTNMIETPYL